MIASDPGSDFLLGLLRQLGATDVQAQEVYDTYMRQFIRGELSELDFWQEMRSNYGLTIHDSISEEFTKWRGLAVEDSVMQLVNRAKAAGLQVAIFSNVIEPTYNALHNAGLYEGFDAIIASCKVGYAKPQPEIYQLALDRLHATAERSLFIDDKQKNLDPAAEMGFATILARSPQQIIDDVVAICPELA